MSITMTESSKRRTLYLTVRYDDERMKDKLECTYDRIEMKVIFE